jgi:hypothetical protein
MTLKYIVIRAMVSIAILSPIGLSLTLWAGAQGRPGRTEGDSGAQPGVQRQKEPAMQTGAEHPPALSAS